MSDSLWPHGLQHASLLCPLLSPSLLKFMPFESVMLSNHLFPPYPISKLPELGTPTCISRWPNFYLSIFLGRPREEGCDWSGCPSRKGRGAVTMKGHTPLKSAQWRPVVNTSGSSSSSGDSENSKWRIFHFTEVSLGILNCVSRLGLPQQTTTNRWLKTTEPTCSQFWSLEPGCSACPAPVSSLLVATLNPPWLCGVMPTSAPPTRPLLLWVFVRPRPPSGEHQLLNWGPTLVQ